MGSDTAEEMPNAEKIEKYLKTPPDDCAIQQYLRLGPPSDLALLAAQMAPNRSRFNAGELVARAAKLQEQAEHHLWLERISGLASCCGRGKFAITHEFKISPQAFMPLPGNFFNGPICRPASREGS